MSPQKNNPQERPSGRKVFEGKVQGPKDQGDDNINMDADDVSFTSYESEEDNDTDKN